MSAGGWRMLNGAEQGIFETGRRILGLGRKFGTCNISSSISIVIKAVTITEHPHARLP